MDHALSDQHKAAMNYVLARGQSKPIVSYSPVVRAFLTLDNIEKSRLMKKIDLYVMFWLVRVWLSRSQFFMHWINLMILI